MVQETIWGSNHFEPFPHPGTQQQLQRWLSLLPRKVKEHTASDPAVLAQSTRHTAKYHKRMQPVTAIWVSSSQEIQFYPPPPGRSMAGSTISGRFVAAMTKTWTCRWRRHLFFPVFYLDWHPIAPRSLRTWLHTIHFRQHLVDHLTKVQLRSRVRNCVQPKSLRTFNENLPVLPLLSAL